MTFRVFFCAGGCGLLPPGGRFGTNAAGLPCPGDFFGTGTAWSSLRPSPHFFLDVSLEQVCLGQSASSCTAPGNLFGTDTSWNSPAFSALFSRRFFGAGAG